MINVKRFGFNTTRANCYVVSDETKECVIIDPCAQGKYERELFQRYIQEEGLKPVRCLLTHGHYDHLLSCDQVRDEFGLLPEVHHRDKLWLDRIDLRIEDVFGEDGFKHDIVKPEHYLQDNEVITFGSHYLITLHAPGHSPGSVVYYCEKEKLAFTGDTLFKDCIGRSDLLFGYDVDLANSLKQLVAILPSGTKIYPGHDEDFLIEYGKEHNKYLRKNTMKNLVILTGAGISKESGLSTFRDEKDSLWSKNNAKELASIWGWRKDREKVLDFYNLRRKNLLSVEPNHAHYVLAELEKDFHVTIITQNVDNLHERAGSTSILHLHGELTKVTSCNNPNGKDFIREKPLDEPIEIGEKAPDGSQMRPFIVFFGENVPNITEAIRIAKHADIFVVIGTSLAVYPAAGLIEKVPWGTPSFILDPGEFEEHQLYGFEHIKMNAVAGIDILKEKLTKLV